MDSIMIELHLRKRYTDLYQDKELLLFVQQCMERLLTLDLAFYISNTISCVIISKLSKDMMVEFVID